MLFSQLLVCFVGSFYYKSFPKQLKNFAVLIFFSTGNMIFMALLAMYNIPNLGFSHISTLIELNLLCIAFYYWIDNTKIKKSILIILILYIIFWIVSKFTFESFKLIGSWTTGTAIIIKITLSIILFIELIKGDSIKWTKDARLWIASGVIISSTGSLFLVVLFNIMLQISYVHLKLVWQVNWVLIIIANVLYIRGFLCKK